MSARRSTGRNGRILRVLLVVTACVGGAACLVYGATRHEREVLVDQEVKLPPALESQRPGAAPWELAPPPVETKRTVGIGLSEPAMVRDVTVGGLIRLESGEIKRTYSGDAPSLCPS